MGLKQLATTTRRYFFQAVHQLTELGEGKHGHDFHLEICFAGTSIECADKTFKEVLKPRLHGQNLGEILEAPTGEALVQWIHKQLLLSPLGPFVLGVAIQETPKNRYISSMTGARFV
jgi:6-pyruvoyl-tetrahydropterin synthase